MLVRPLCRHRWQPGEAIWGIPDQDTTPRVKLVKIGAKVVKHSSYVPFQLAEVAVSKDLFRKILSLLDDLRRRPAPA